MKILLERLQFHRIVLNNAVLFRETCVVFTEVILGLLLPSHIITELLKPVKHISGRVAHPLRMMPPTLSVYRAEGQTASDS